MLSFKKFIEERSVDPIDLARRASAQYGKRTRYGYWESPIKGQHIPLSSFNSRTAEKVDDRRYAILKSFGHTAGKDREQDNKSIERYNSSFSPKTMSIKDLNATQPFVRTDDVEQLKNKLKNSSPDNIRIAQHKGKNYILDGHHSVMAAKLRGEKDISVNHINFDELGV